MIPPSIFKISVDTEDKDVGRYFPYMEEYDKLLKEQDLTNCYIYVDRGNEDEF